MVNPLGFIVTIIVFKSAELLKKYPLIGKIPPVLVSGITIILLLKLFNIDYESYNQSACWLTFLLIPATISLGYPLYKNLNVLIKNKRVIYSAFAFASCCAITTTYITAKLCHINTSLMVSMLPKSVTAPIAIEISKSIGGVPELTACVVVLTGICGALLAHRVLELVHIKNDIAIGLSIGATSHVIGTSSCIERNRPIQVVMSTLALVIAGILTAFLAPLFVNIIL